MLQCVIIFLRWRSSKFFFFWKIVTFYVKNEVKVFHYSGEVEQFQIEEKLLLNFFLDHLVSLPFIFSLITLVFLTLYTYIFSLILTTISQDKFDVQQYCWQFGFRDMTGLERKKQKVDRASLNPIYVSINSITKNKKFAINISW